MWLGAISQVSQGLWVHTPTREWHGPSWGLGRTSSIGRRILGTAPIITNPCRGRAHFRASLDISPTRLCPSHHAKYAPGLAGRILRAHEMRLTREGAILTIPVAARHSVRCGGMAGCIARPLGGSVGACAPSLPRAPAPLGHSE